MYNVHSNTWKIYKKIVLGDTVNKETQKIYDQSELSLWDLFRLLYKNIIPVIIIVVAVTLLGAFYSFVIQDQNIVTYSIRKLVIYDDWDYYPTAIEYSYPDNIQTFINDELGGDYVDYVSVGDSNSRDLKSDYVLKLIFKENITQTQVDAISQKLPAWHNSMMDDGVAKIITDNEVHQNELLLNYIDSEKEYYDYVNSEQNADADYDVQADMLKAKRDLKLEILNNHARLIVDIESDILNIEHYYINEIQVTSTRVSTWQNNMILSVSGGLALAIVFVIMKESYKQYKSNKI